MSDTIDEYKMDLWMSVIVFTLKNICWKLMWCGVVCKLICSQWCGVVRKLICSHIPTHTHTHLVIVTYAHCGWNLWKRTISKFILFWQYSNHLTPLLCLDEIFHTHRQTHRQSFSALCEERLLLKHEPTLGEMDVKRFTGARIWEKKNCEENHLRWIQ